MSTQTQAIPILDLKRQYLQHQAEIDAAVAAVLASGHFILGPQVKQFEAAMAQHTGTAHAIGVASGSDALYLALKALNIGPGDEVITTAFSYVATSESIVRAGARPVFVEIDPQTFNLDLSCIEAAITPKTKALMPVHLYGHALDMQALLVISQKHQLPIIEDCAQAIGAKDADGRRVGSQGTIGCFSCFPTKNLGAFGDGGFLTTQNDQLAAKLRMLRTHGSNPENKYDHWLAGGLNSRLDELQAAILNVKVAYIDGWNTRRAQIAQRYNAAFVALSGVHVPIVRESTQHVFHQYTLKIGNQQRDAFQKALAEHGVQSMVYYPIALHLQQLHQDLGYQPGALPVTERVAQQVLSLPIYPELTDAEIERIIAAVTQVARQLLA